MPPIMLLSPGTVFERSALRLAGSLLLLIDPLLEFLTNLEEGQFLGRNLNALSCLGVSSRIGVIFPDDKASESPDLNTAVPSEFVGKSFKYEIYQVNRLLFGQVFLST